MESINERLTEIANLIYLSKIALAYAPEDLLHQSINSALEIALSEIETIQESE